MMPSFQDLIAVALRLLALADEAADMLAMPAPEWDERLRQAHEDLDNLLATMEG